MQAQTSSLTSSDTPTKPGWMQSSDVASSDEQPHLCRRGKVQSPLSYHLFAASSDEQGQLGSCTANAMLQAQTSNYSSSDNRDSTGFGALYYELQTQTSRISPSDVVPHDPAYRFTWWLQAHMSRISPSDSYQTGLTVPRLDCQLQAQTNGFTSSNEVLDMIFGPGVGLQTQTSSLPLLTIILVC